MTVRERTPGVDCICGLCCCGFPCDKYTWETACAEAFAPGKVEEAVRAAGMEPVETIVITFGVARG